MEKQVVLHSCLTPEGTINLRLAAQPGPLRSLPGAGGMDGGHGRGERGGPGTCRSITPGARELDAWPGGGGGGGGRPGG